MTCLANEVPLEYVFILVSSSLLADRLSTIADLTSTTRRHISEGSYLHRHVC